MYVEEVLVLNPKAKFIDILMIFIKNENLFDLMKKKSYFLKTL